MNIRQYYNNVVSKREDILYIVTGHTVFVKDAKNYIVIEHSVEESDYHYYGIIKGEVIGGHFKFLDDIPEIFNEL